MEIPAYEVDIHPVPVQQEQKEQFVPIKLPNQLKTLLQKEFGYPWNFYDCLEFSGYWIVFSVQQLVITGALSSQGVEKSDAKYAVAQTLNAGFAVLVLFECFFMKFRLTALRSLVVFVLGFLVPLIVLLVLLYEFEQYNPAIIVLISLIIGGVGFQFFLRWIKQKLFQQIGKLRGSIFCIGVNALFWGITVTGTFYIALTTNIYDISFYKSISLIIFIPYLIFLVIFWYLIHLFYIKQFPSQVQILREKVIKENQEDMMLQIMMKKYPDLLYDTYKGCWLVFSEYKHIFASITLISALIFCQIGLFVVYVEWLEDQHQTNVAILVVFYFLVAPVFLFGGVVFSASNIKKDDKFCTAISLFILLGGVLQPVGYLLYYTEQTEILGLIFMAGYPFSIFYWVSMSMLFHHYKRAYQLVSPLFCLTLIIPLWFLLPFYTEQAIQETTFIIFLSILGIGGVLLIVLFWLIDFIIKFRVQMFALRRGFKKLNSYDIVQYSYTIGFILSFTALLYIYVSNFDNESWTSGLVGGSIAILIFCIFSTVVTHRVILYVKNSQKEQLTLKKIIKGDIPEPTLLQKRSLRKKKKYQKVITVIGMIFPLILLIILISNYNQAENIIQLASTLVAGFVVVSLVVLILIEIKSFLRQFGEGVVNYFLGGCWYLCLIPIFVLIPITLSFADDQSTLSIISSLTIGFFFFLCLGSVGTASILINSFFKRMRYEKRAKYCLQRLKYKLSQSGVRSNFPILRIIYDWFYLNGKDMVNKILKEKTIISYIDIPDNDPDLEHSKEIKTLKQVNKFKKKQEKANRKLKSQQLIQEGVGCFTYLKKCFSSCTEKHLPNQSNKIANAPQNEKQHPSSQNNPTSPVQSEQARLLEQQQNQKQQQLKNHLLASQGNQNIEAKVITEQIRKKLQQEDHFQIRKNDLIVRQHWYQAVFQRFSHGFHVRSKQSYMTKKDLKNFLRLSGLGTEFYNAYYKKIYTKITGNDNQGSSKVSNQKIMIKDFKNILLKVLSEQMFPELSLQEAQNSLFQYFIYPNLVTNLPFLTKKTRIESKRESVPPVHAFSIIKVPQQVDNESQIPDFDILASEGSFISENQNMVEVKPSRIFRYLDRCFNAIINFVQKMTRKLLVFLKIVFDKLLMFFMLAQKDQSQKDQSQIQEIEQQVKDNEIVPLFRVLSPQWEQICDIITQSLDQFLKEARKQELTGFNEWSLNTANITGIIIHLIQVFSFGALAFSSQVGWQNNSHQFQDTIDAVFLESKYWEYTFWVAVGVVFAFGLLLCPIVKLIRKGRLGMNQDMTKVNFPSFQFFMEKSLTILGKSLYLIIVAVLLTPFACELEDNGDWIVKRNQDMECLGEEHALYLIWSIVALGIYYPAATLLYPNIQYKNKNLDIKFDTSFLVLESQAKVIIAGFSVFFSGQNFISLQLGVTILVCFLLSIISFKRKPCLLEFYNLWKGGGYLIVVWVCTWALVNVVTGQYLVSIIFLVSGTVIIIGILGLLQYKLYGCNRQKSQKSIRNSFQGTKEIVKQISKECFKNSKEKLGEYCDEAPQIIEFVQDNHNPYQDQTQNKIEFELQEEEI